MLKIYDQGFFFIVLRIRDLVGIFGDNAET